MKRAAAFILLLGVGLIVVWTLFPESRADEARYASATREIMATPVTVLAPEARAAEAATIVFDVFNDVDRMMSEWKPGSPLAAVNDAAGKRPVEVPPALDRVIRRGIEIGDLTDGAFDITWAAMWGLWDFQAVNPEPPADDEIRQRIALIDSRTIVLDDTSRTVFLPREGMLIGLGGIAKGTALDRAARELGDAGIDSFLISAGGQIIARGKRGDRPWRTGIRDPRGEGPDDYFATLELRDESVATSGDYERFFIHEGVRYHHILDPRTGRPSRGLRSVTVLSPDAELADALSTAFMILGLERSRALAARLDNVEALFIDDSAVVHMTPGLADCVKRLRAPSK